MVEILEAFATLCYEGGRRGTAYVLTVMALPMLLGVGALAIDLTLMSLAAQRVQNVADTAALAGAVQASDAATSANAAAETAEANNSFSAWHVSTTAHRYGPGEEVPDFRVLGETEHVVEVQGTTTFEFSFARIFGLEQATVRRSATALSVLEHNRLCEGFVFAGSTDPNVWGIYSEGLGNQFNGALHSNTGISLNGGDNSVTGNITYRNAYEQNGPNFTHDGTASESPTLDYPVDYAWEDYDIGPWDHEVDEIYVNTSGASLASGRWHVNGDMFIGGSDFSCHDALFVVEGDIVFKAARPILDRVTLVASGTIDFQGADGRFSPYVDGLFAFTPMTSASNVMVVDGSRCEASGVLFAPNGGLYFSGSPMINYRVGLCASTITLIGGGMIHDGPDVPLAYALEPRVQLIQ